MTQQHHLNLQTIWPKYRPCKHENYLHKISCYHFLWKHSSLPSLSTLVPPITTEEYRSNLLQRYATSTIGQAIFASYLLNLTFYRVKMKGSLLKFFHSKASFRSSPIQCQGLVQALPSAFVSEIDTLKDKGCQPEEWGTIHFFTVITICKIWRISPKTSCFKQCCLSMIAAWYLYTIGKQLQHCENIEWNITTISLVIPLTCIVRTSKWSVHFLKKETFELHPMYLLDV